jgi:hypothetical protein
MFLTTTGNGEGFFRRTSLREHLQAPFVRVGDASVNRCIDPIWEYLVLLSTSTCHRQMAAARASSVIGGARHSIDEYMSELR